MTMFATPSRIFFRIKKFGLNFTFCFAYIQTLEGITSLLPNGKHIILWDLDGCSLEEAKKTLRDVQRQYNLSDIFIVSDMEGSYRAFCYTQVDFNTYLKILLDTKFLDWNFFDYTVRRKKATLRVSKKKGRPKQRIISALLTFYVPIPKEKIKTAIYDTGVEKEGLSIILGDK